MPWRSRPQAAFATGLLWASPLLAAEGFICAHIVRESLRAIPEAHGCATIRADRWSLLPGVEYTGRLSIALPARSGGAMLFIVGDSLPPDLEIESRTGAPVPLRSSRIEPVTTAPPDYWLEFGSPWAAPRHVVGASIGSLPDRPHHAVVNLGRRAPRVLARLDGYDESARGRVCAAPVDARPAFRTQPTFAISALDERYFATGWIGIEPARDGGAQRLLDRHGVVLVPSLKDGRVRVRVMSAAAEGPLALSVNDQPEMLAPSHAGAFEWLVPASAWVTGTNELLFRVVGDTPRRVGITRIELALE